MEESPQHLNYYRLSPSEVLDSLKSKPKGLSSEEASRRLKANGLNELAKLSHDNFLVIFIRQFKNLLVIMLLLSAGLSIYLKDAKTAIILILIALMNAFVGFFQEFKAES